MDASPWGLGGSLIIDSRVYGYFGAGLTKHDERILSAKIGSDESQQIFESLVILVAMKLWLHVLKAKRVALTLTGDNNRALAMTAKLKITASPIIARELAMTLCESAFQPRVISHLPGVMNGHADALSRLSEHGGRHSIPAELAGCKRAHPPKRDESFYTTLTHTAWGGQQRVVGWVVL